MKNLNVFLYGGIGNQLFQYAFAKKLSIKYKMNLILNLYGFETDKFYKRKFDLENFQISYLKIESGKGLIFNICRVMQHYPKLSEILRLFFRKLLVEKTNIFENNRIKIDSNKNLYLYGYWQNELYFKDVKEQIVEDFKLNSKLSIDNEALVKKIHQQNCVSVHIRMLHMVKSENKDVIDVNKNMNYRLTESYYVKALNYICSQVSNPIFYVFSDKPDDARTFLKPLLYNFVFLDNSRGSDFEDLVLMSKFDHNIIANSSFSWWGAWLGDNEKKLIIAPKDTVFTPVIPDHWIQI